MRMLSFRELKEKKGIPFSRQHLHRLIKAGRFPPPAKLGDNTNAWAEPEVDAHLEDVLAARDASRTEAA